MNTKLKLFLVFITGLLIAWVAVVTAAHAFQESKYNNIARNMTANIEMGFSAWEDVHVNHDMYENQKDLLTHVCGIKGQPFEDCDYISEEQLQKFHRYENGALVDIIKKKR